MAKTPHFHLGSESQEYLLVTAASQAVSIGWSPRGFGWESGLSGLTQLFNRQTVNFPVIQYES